MSTANQNQPPRRGLYSRQSRKALKIHRDSHWTPKPPLISGIPDAPGHEKAIPPFTENMPIPNLLDGSAATLDGLSLVKPLEPMSDELSRTSDARICLETPLILGNRLANEDYSFVLEPRYIVRFKSCERLETSTPEPCYLGQPHVLDDGLASDDTQPMSTIVPLKPLPKLHPTDQSSPLPESMATSSAFCFCSDEGSKDSPSGPSSSHPKNMDEVKVSDHRTLSTNRQVRSLALW